MKPIKQMVFAAGIAAAMLAVACNKNSDPAPATGEGPAPQSFSVRMTDAAANYAGLDMKITRVDAYLEGQGWVNLSSNTQSVNILSLRNGSEMMLAHKTNISSGTYTRVKITFDQEAMLRFNSNVTFPGGNADDHVLLTWGGEREVEIVINENVNASAGADVLLDFDVAQSVVEKLGEYYIKPVVQQVKDFKTGIEGSIDVAAKAVIILSNDNGSYSTYADAGGKFLIRGVKPGTYKMLVLPSPDDISRLGLNEQYTFEAVMISQSQIKHMGVITLK